MKMKDTGEEPMNRGGRHRGKHARGGHAKEHVNEYNAQGSPEMHEAADEKDEFKKGGKKHKAGGVALGAAAPTRGDKAARGRAAGGKAPEPKKLARGGECEEDEKEHHARGGRTGSSPWSSGSRLSAPEREKSGNKEGISVPAED